MIMQRRRFLKAAGVCMALPMLDIDAAPKKTKTLRMACLYFPNGTTRSSWQPDKVSKSGKLVQLNSYMKDLQPFKDDISIPSLVRTPSGNGHGFGTATWLSGGGFNGKSLSVGGPTVDQIAAKHICKDTPLSSLQLSMKGEGYFSKDITRNNISWITGSLPASREVEPRQVFDSMFRPSKSSLSSASILDQIKDQAKDIAKKGSSHDKEKIEEYLDSVRSIERKIQFTEKRQQLLAKLEDINFKRPAAGIPEDYQSYMRIMLDLVVLAFYVDITRVATFMLDHGQSVRYCDFVPGVKGTWHALSHYKDISGKTEDDDGKTSWSTVAEKQSMYEKVAGWHNKQFAYFLSKLKSLKTPEGTLLDNSLIMYGSSLGNGHTHGDKLPIIFAGGAGGAVKTGQYIKSDQALDLNGWHLAALQTLGVRQERFGTARSTFQDFLK